MKRVVFLSFFLFFLFFQSTSIYGGDAGDLVTAAFTGSTAHPPGYPLYSLIGYLLSMIPWSTIAWRVTLLSSISMAGALTFIFMILRRLTNSTFVSYIASAAIGTSYLMLLYAIVPEVFALHALLMASLLYLSLEFINEPSKKKALGMIFISGIGMSHHHLIILMYPLVMYALLQHKTFVWNTSVKEKIIAGLLFASGLLPYVWAYIAALRLAPVTWDDPTSISNFVRLISRADYGSFKSGIAIGQSIQSRLLQLPAMFDLYLQDLSYIGVLVSLIGFIGIIRQSFKKGILILGGFLLYGPVYFFYASYLFTTSFHIATAERFLIPSYIFIAIGYGYGLNIVLKAMKAYSRIVFLLTVSVMIMIPIVNIASNAPKVHALKDDRTAEHYGRDLLNSIDRNGIFFLVGDHPVFNTQYVYYTQDYRNDVKIIHLTKLLNGTGERYIEHYYPDITIADTTNSVERLLTLIEKYASTISIYSTSPFELIPEGYQWVPEGLLFRLYAIDNIPSYAHIQEHTDKLWRKYQHPFDGSLGKYKNLMLWNIAESYKDAAVRQGLYAAVNGEDYITALRYYDYALGIEDGESATYYLKGNAFARLKNCDAAEDMYQTGESLDPDNQSLYIRSMLELSRDCREDDDATASWQGKLDELQEGTETLLKEL